MAIRLIFETDGNEIRLLRKKRVDMEPPGSPQMSAQSGIVAEMRDAEDHLLHQQPLGDLEPGIEVFGPEGVHREEMPGMNRTFMLVLPEHEAAASLVFVDAREREDGRFAATTHDAGPREIARFSLGEDEQ